MGDEKREHRSSIFGEAPFDEPQAYVGINRGAGSFGLYAAGFFDAGQQLAQAMLRNEAKVDLSIYALVYLYRHGTELALKQLARSFGEIHRGDPLSELDGLKGNEKHSLQVLWDRVGLNVEYAISMAGPSMDFPGDVGLDEVAATIGELHSFDPAGVVFRYPESLGGDLHLPDVECINIRVFCQAMSRLVSALETWRHHLEGEANYHWYARVVEPWIANQ